MKGRKRYSDVGAPLAHSSQQKKHRRRPKQLHQFRHPPPPFCNHFSLVIYINTFFIKYRPMIHTPNLLLLAVFFLVASSHTSHLTSAFSIPPAIRPITTSCHPSSPLYTTRTVSENTDCVIDDSGTSDKQVEINPDKAAVIFLHGLGDSPDGWSKLTEALPNLRPNLAMLDITYVFPPASMVGITVNGGEFF
jgi:hypothetical protein